MPIKIKVEDIHLIFVFMIRLLFSFFSYYMLMIPCSIFHLMNINQNWLIIKMHNK